jgi:hypothetical protein
MSKTERGNYRFSVKETAHGTFFLAAEPAGDAIKGLYGLLGFHLQEGTTFEEALRFADLMNNKITSLTLTKSE